MKTDVDSALRGIADWYIRNRREMTEPELEAILKKHCESEEEIKKFVKFLETEPGQMRFKTLLRERKELPSLQETRYIPRSTIPEPYATIIRRELRKQPTSKLREVYEALKRGRPTGVELVEQNRAYALSAVEEVLWERGQLSEKEPLEDNVEVYTSSELPPEIARDVGLHRDPQVEYRYTTVYSGPDLNYFRRDLEKLLRERTGKPYLVVDAYYIGTSYLKESNPVELPPQVDECQIISPEYYDMLPWLNIPVPDYSFSIEPETKERKIDQVLQKLKDGVARIHESAVFREFLITMAKFHDYSIGNQILIMLQRPTATRVAGIKTWNQLGRYVKRGERGIAILAPCLPPRILKCPICGRTFPERELRAHILESHPEADVAELVRQAREEMEAVIPTPTYFKVVYVFDVSQTEGKPLPEFVVPVLSGAYNRQLYDKLMKLAAKHGLSVSFESRPELGPEVKGMLYGNTIWIRPEEPEAQKLKTLAHELAHYFTEHVYFIPKAEAEVIAESVAFVVGAHFGFDTGTRSFPYVALWAKEKKVLEQNLASIRKISARMIDELGG